MTEENTNEELFQDDELATDEIETNETEVVEIEAETVEEEKVSFYDLDFCDEVLDSIEAMGFEYPTPIQAMAIPIISAGKDIIGCAQTGTGKTAAFLLPVIDQLIKNPQEGISVLIIAPTRELALQIDRQVEGLGYYTGIGSAPIYGGSDPGIWENQKRAMMRKVDILVATPGRMIGHLSFSYAKALKNVRFLILDEADRMLDMGFYDDIMTIIDAIPKKRQNLMFSATMPPKIRKMAKEILNDPAEISLAISKPAENLVQLAYSVHDSQKIGLVTSILKEKKDFRSIVVFCSSKRSVAEVNAELKRRKFSVRAMHSDLSQDERQEALRLFKAQRFQIVVATDVMSRGIDIDTIDLVINYDVPRDPEDYVHRIGRTARAQADGIGITFINPKEQRGFARIEKLIEREVEKLPLPDELGRGPVYDPFGKKKSRSSGGRSGGGRGRNDRRGSNNRNSGGRNNRSSNNNRGRNDNRRNDDRRNDDRRNDDRRTDSRRNDDRRSDDRRNDNRRNDDRRNDDRRNDNRRNDDRRNDERRNDNRRNDDRRNDDRRNDNRRNDDRQNDDRRNDNRRNDDRRNDDRRTDNRHNDDRRNDDRRNDNRRNDDRRNDDRRNDDRRTDNQNSGNKKPSANSNRKKRWLKKQKDQQASGGNSKEQNNSKQDQDDKGF